MPRGPPALDDCTDCTLDRTSIRLSSIPHLDHTPETAPLWPPPASHPGLSSVATRPVEDQGLVAQLNSLLENFELRLMEGLDKWALREKGLLDDLHLAAQGDSVKEGHADKARTQQSDAPPAAVQSTWSLSRKHLQHELAFEVYPALSSEQGLSAADIAPHLRPLAPDGEVVITQLPLEVEMRAEQGLAMASQGELRPVACLSEKFTGATYSPTHGTQAERCQRSASVACASPSERPAGRNKSSNSDRLDMAKRLTYSEYDGSRRAAATRKAAYDRSNSSLEDVNLNGQLARLVNSNRFEATVAILIFLGSFLIGVEVELETRTNGEPLPVGFFFLDSFFAGAFTLELLLRLVALRGKFFARAMLHWSCVDIVLVISALVETYLQAMLLLGAVGTNSADDVSQVRLLRVLRITRILRTMRMSRLVPMIASLRTLVASIFATLQSLMWAMLLLLILIYTVAVVFTHAANEHFLTYGHDAALQEFWGTLPVSMLTLFESIAGGLSWHEVLQPLYSVSLWLVAFFGLYIFFTYFAVLNVITAVFCQSAIETVAQDPDLVAQSVLQRKRLYAGKLESLFSSVDKDCSGQISITELEKLLADEHMQAYMAAMGVDIDDAWTMFKLMDVDNNLSIDLNEFVSGMTRLQGSARSADVQSMLETQRWMTRRLASLTTDAGQKVGNGRAEPS